MCLQLSMKNSLIKTSKLLSFLLRHNPQSIGLTLDHQGWAKIDELIICLNKNGKKLSRDIIFQVVEKNDKQRFMLSNDLLRIKANQGHSLTIDLDLDPSEPPQFLYHGTATRFLDSIQVQGLLPSGRHHVHLSDTLKTAYNVGKRHGKPVVLIIEAEKMMREEFVFYQSANGVWLTSKVPPEYFSCS
ncbi:RNA:NAD 2'-phosphotransferase [hydrothermal vent metagenome]|uniref:RNA:NAD 2'-phosphotransferase n=1 Tax=hydrothermal vent metagenome TaxID=652676 RepID=A0A3B0YMK8_9ZZZZ